MDKLDGIFEEEHEDRLKNPYAKSSRLYLQQMEDLEKSMPTEEYTLFAEKGYFTIHRCDSFWSGNFSDQTIEQCLMRTLKTSGGLFTGVVHTGTSEQHKDLRQSTQSRDSKDRSVFVAWLQDHPPFAGYHADQLVSLSTGIVADASVNCDDAVEIGQRAASEMSGKKFRDIKLRRKDKVVTIGAKHKTVQVRGQQVEVNPTLLFNRITCVLNNSSDMESFLTFKLAPQPPALFQDGVVRKAAKSSLGLLLRSFTQQTKLSENSLYVLDGGHLLQSVIWPKPSNHANYADDVCLSYISYILKHYGNSTTVVFDGYGNQPSTTEQTSSNEGCRRIHTEILCLRRACPQLQLKLHLSATVTIRRGLSRD